MEALSDPNGRLVLMGMVRVLPNPGAGEGYSDCSFQAWKPRHSLYWFTCRYGGLLVQDNMVKIYQKTKEKDRENITSWLARWHDMRDVVLSILTYSQHSDIIVLNTFDDLSDTTDLVCIITVKVIRSSLHKFINN